MRYLFPALHFQSVCVPGFEVGLLETAYIGVLFLYLFTQSLSFGGIFNPFTFEVIIDKYDPITIYFVILGSFL